MNSVQVDPGRYDLFHSQKGSSYVVKPAPYSPVQYRFEVVVGRNARRSIFVLSKDEITARKVAKEVTGLPVIAIQIYRPDQDCCLKEFVRQID